MRESEREAYERVGATLPQGVSYLARQLKFYDPRLSDLTYRDSPIPIYGGWLLILWANALGIPPEL